MCEIRALDEAAESHGLDRGDFIMRVATGRPMIEKKDVVLLMTRVADFVNLMCDVREVVNSTGEKAENLEEEIRNCRDFYSRLVRFGTEFGHRSHSSANRERPYLNIADGNRFVRCVIRLTPDEKEILDRKVKKSGLCRRDYIASAVKNWTDADAGKKKAEALSLIDVQGFWMHVLLYMADRPGGNGGRAALSFLSQWRMPHEPLEALLGGSD